MKQLLSILDVARLLEIPEHKINYAHRAGYLADVKRVAGKRVYSPADVERVRAYFQAKEKQKDV